MQVLVIDDEVRKAQTILSYFREICEWDVEIAPSPDAALMLLKERESRPYDLIILDIMMDPGTVIPRDLSDGGKATGLLLLDLIAKLTGGKTRVVLYTARTDLDYLMNEGRVAGYIQKPRTVRDLAREIEHLVGLTGAK